MLGRNLQLNERRRARRGEVLPVIVKDPYRDTEVRFKDRWTLEVPFTSALPEDAT